MEAAPNQESRFKALSATSLIVSMLGWLTAGGGAIVSLIGIVTAMGSRRSNLFGAVTAAGSGFLIAVAGMLVVAAGQLISCILAIEENTRATSAFQKALLESMGNKVPTVAVAAKAPQKTGDAPRAREDGDYTPQQDKTVTCPSCRETECVQNLYDVGQYQKFDAVDKSKFGFQTLSLTCRHCGHSFRV